MRNVQFSLQLYEKKFKHSTLLFTDTGSLCYECDEDLYEKICKNKELFDLSNLLVSSKHYCSDN